MEGRTRISSIFHGEEFKALARGEAHRAVAYLAGALTLVGIGDAGLIASHRFGQHEDAIIEVAILSFSIAGKVFMGLRRDDIDLTPRDRLKMSRVSHREQLEIAQDGSFMKKSALLSNPRIKRKPLALLREDDALRQELIEELRGATRTFSHYRKMLDKYPAVYYYHHILAGLEEDILEFTGNLHLLHADGAIRKKFSAAA